MKLYDNFSAYDSFFVCGDIHGEFKTLLYEIKRKGISDAIILLDGDCGIGFEEPEYFQNSLIDFPLMKTLPDYSVIRFKTRNILCVGGAVSVDRSGRLQAMWLAGLKERTAPKYYWEDEMPVFDQISLSELKIADIQIDTVVTHTAPSFCAPLFKTGIEGWLLRDEKLAEYIAKEREVMDEIHNCLFKEGHPVKHWFYGHFHNSHTEYISDICFRMLSVMELCELRKGI
ncbi:MAG: hypothetical protein WC110_01685 [Bacteroidales bacterium]|jgi:hypothetical protein|nr:hypothetical protein [Bacteroidales bacterium]MDD4257399.1 hypothetical protein [Bacteroidales bacterium]MDD4654047.1 hypothetical protein [Bacteroidales bacterium]MDD4827913.1 hypothetical protein [Bacteroidales bacterium]